ncbi:hypothetical protein E1293_06580 [Actinomadura darangshiensis]|uniref:Uncharacterized protein n=1 Tax=Actinomadura darangshiensis TaxID=705336 RepID=A0A4R5BN97_9ACTN|nr:hypothetical protein [Actinomadura darangshiensis]TDD88318.1 hypothetical protein E1293_06580 [Actinomadura darangshiensis]
MIQAVDTADDSSPAIRLRHELADTLLARGHIVSAAVDNAFRTVPRALFVPAGTALDVVYSVDSPVITKTDEHGAHISSVSATYIQARMIEMAGLAPGMAVLEIGSGGYNGEVADGGRGARLREVTAAACSAT